MLNNSGHKMSNGHYRMPQTMPSDFYFMNFETATHDSHSAISTKYIANCTKQEFAMNECLLYQHKIGLSQVISWFQSGHLNVAALSLMFLRGSDNEVDHHYLRAYFDSETGCYPQVKERCRAIPDIIFSPFL